MNQVAIEGLTTPLHKPQFVTLTGLDGLQDIQEANALSREHPHCEWGLLYTPKLAGQENRYPELPKLKQMLETLEGNVALHLCGGAVLNFLEGEATVSQLVDLVRQKSGRIQLNFQASRKQFSSQALIQAINAHGDLFFITQLNMSNVDISATLLPLRNHGFLQDASGGRGLNPDFWTKPIKASQGYAGGLGPTNISQELLKIHAAAEDHPYWVDMEGRLRTAEDRFDIHAAATVLEIIESQVPAKPCPNQFLPQR